MNILFIGGTGTISTAISRELLQRMAPAALTSTPAAADNPFAGGKLYLLNRGNQIDTDLLPYQYCQLTCDINDEAAVEQALGNLTFDVVCDFIAFVPAQVERDYRLFRNRTRQYMFISSASAYQKPLADYRVTEATPLANPYWEYSRNKIACEEFLMKMYREEGFPVTIIRPSHTYDERSVPLGVHGKNGSWPVIRRIQSGKPVIIHGDGTSLWTLTHNSDFAQAFLGLMGNIHAIGEAVQITSDETVTWNQIYSIIAQTLQQPLYSVHVSSEFLAACGDEPSYSYDFTGSLIGDKANSVVFENTKLKKLVPDFTAKVRADQGIAAAIRYILAHPEYQQEDAEFDRFCDAVIAAREQAIQQVKATL